MSVYRNFVKPYFQHPLNRNAKFKAALIYIKWQLLLRIAALYNSWLVIRHETGLRLIVKKGQYGITGNIYSGLHEFAEMLFVIHFLREDDLFFDIGANMGMYTLLAAGVCKAKTYSFEPVPSTYFFLKSNVMINNLEGRAQCFELGVGDKGGSVRFSSDLDAMNKVIDESYNGNTINSEIVQLDSLFGQALNNHVMLKIDTEGYEVNVLHGALEVLANPWTKVVLVEMNDRAGIHRELSKYGFEPYNYNPLKRILQKADHSLEANIIYIKDKAFVDRRIMAAAPFVIRGQKF